MGDDATLQSTILEALRLELDPFLAVSRALAGLLRVA